MWFGGLVLFIGDGIFGLHGLFGFGVTRFGLE